MRTMSILLAMCVGACGPIYPDQQAARAPAPDPQAQPPPASAEGGQAEELPRPRAQRGPATAPADPYAEAAGPTGPADPYAQAPPIGPAAPPRAPAKPAPPPPPPPPAAGLSRDAQALLDAHNRVRAKHCAAPLRWSPQLAQAAQQWATSLRDQGCKFGHSGGKYGENLAAGTSGTLDGSSVTAMWYDEIALYKFPDGGFSMKTGHFTQVVWRDSTQLGCAIASCNNMDIWVCEYDPPGNVQGGYRQNVQPLGCR